VDRAATLDLLLRGIAAGTQLALGLALVRSAFNRSLAIATMLFFGSNLAFLLNGSRAINQLFGPFNQLLWLIQIGSAGQFWLFAVVLFEDRPLTIRSFLPSALLTAVGLVAQFGNPPFSAWLWAAHNIIGLLLALHVMFIIIRSGREDLVEARRQLRVPFLAIVAAYSMLVSAAQIGRFAGIDSDWYTLANVMLQVLLGLLGAVMLLEARAELFGRAEPETAAATGDGMDAMWLARLDAIMASDSLWRREGLTIGDLAAAIGLPEHRLRRLINDRLGHRNFPAFINHHRIAAARETLADPNSAGRTVASIAYDLGFGSLGPFNRAFRDATGITPTEFRRRALVQSSPIPENTG
jgi:AraC-like DNA-binding protein